MARLSGGKILVESILRQGVDTIFGLPGGQTYEVFDSLYGRENDVRLVTSRSEQGAGYMAFGYARSTGKVGVFTVVPGPGILNASAAISTAYSCNAPVLCVTGQVPSAGIGRGIGFLHDLPDQLGVLQRLTKWAARIEHPAHAPHMVNEAFRYMTTGRPRPVALEMAPDIMTQVADVDLPDPAALPEPIVADPDLIAKAAELLGNAQNPMILLGGGAVHAAEEVRELAEMLQAPVVSQRSGRGILSDRHYLSHTFPAGHRLWPKVDVAIAVGTRFKYPRMHWGMDSGLKTIHIDIDPTEINRVFTPDVGIVADARQALRALVDAVAKVNRKRPSRKEEFENFQATMRQEFVDNVQPQMAIIDAIRQALPDDGIFVDEITQVGYTSWYGMPFYAPRTLISSGYAGNLGYGLATAIGVKVGNPDRKVVAINGDGGFMFHCGELATAVKYNLNMIIIIFNDGNFTNVARAQATHYNGRVIGTDLKNPDFAAMAEAFGAKGVKARTPDEIKQQIVQGFRENGPVVIEVPLTKTDFPWKYLLLPQVRGQK